MILPKWTKLALIALLFLSGQLWLLQGTVMGALLSLGALFLAYLWFASPTRSGRMRLFGALALTCIVFAQATVKARPLQGMVLFIVAGACLWLAKPSDVGWFAQGRIPEAPSPFRKWEPFFFLLLALLALGSRLWGLNDLPPGAIGQEGELAGYYLTNLEKGAYAPFTLDWGNLPVPTSTVYQAGFVAKWLGWSAGNLRIPNAIWGGLSVLFFYFVARRLTSPGTAAIVSLLYLANLTHLVLSRRFYPFSILFVTIIVGFGFLLQGIKKPKLSTFILAGAAVGLSLHGYDPGRGVFIIFFSWFLGLALFHRQDLPSWRMQLWFWLSFIIVGFPTLYTVATHWADFWYYPTFHANSNRDKGLGGHLKYLLQVLPAYAQGLYLRSDLDHSLHATPVPLLDPVAGALFGAGFFFCLLMGWEAVPMFLLLALGAGLMPAMLGTNYGHPTTRRMLMAFPFIYLIGAMALERLRTAFSLPGRRWAGWLMGVIGLLAAGWAVQNGWTEHFERFVKDPRVKAEFYHKGYLCGQEMRAHPQAKTTMQAMIPFIQFPMLLPRDRPFSVANSYEALLTFDPRRDNLLLLESYMEFATAFFKKHFPGAEIHTYHETVPNEPEFDTWHFYKFGTDPQNRTGILTRVLIPARDVIEFQSMLEVRGQRPPERLPVFQPGFADDRQGRSLECVGTLLVQTPGTARFSLEWPGWQVSLDGRPLAWDTPVTVSNGAHSVRLKGRVPVGAQGALPLKITSGSEELVAAGCVVALWNEPELKISLWETPQAWKGAPQVVRVEPLPVKRFCNPLDFGNRYSYAALCETRVRIPKDGTYQFLLGTTCRSRLLMNGTEVYNNLKDAERPLRSPLDCRAGQVLEVQGYFLVGEGELLTRTFMLEYQVPGQPRTFVPWEWYMSALR